MSESTTELCLVLVYDHRTKTALWLTPAHAARLEAAIPTSEQIALNDPNYGLYAAMAGPRPVIMVRSSG